MNRYYYRVLWAITILFWGASATGLVLADEGASAKLQPAKPIIVRNEQTQALPDTLKKYMKKRRIPEGAIGIFVHDVNADAPLLLHEADTPRNPASTMKLVTTWGALKVLGPAWTWDTEAWIRGELNGDVLEGDLVLKGYGDPFLVYETFWLFVHNLRLKGIREITGDVIVDNSFFDLPPIDPGAFDNRPDRVYNAPPSALMFNFQATRLLLKPDADQKKVEVTTVPQLHETTIDNRLEWVQGRCRKSHYRPVIERKSDYTLQISGKYANDCGQREITRVVSGPERHLFDGFKSIWEDLGGHVRGTLRTGSVRASDQRIHVHTSGALAEQVRLINKWSNNVMTRQLLLSMGAKDEGAPATLEKGRVAVLEALGQQGVMTEGIVVDNGSGLSRDSRISASQLGALLMAVWREPYMPELLNSLPLLGEDGTLGRRFRNSELKGRSRLKTGTLRQVTAIAGYMLTRSGKRVVIVMMHNGKKADSHGQALQNRLLEWVFEQ